MREFLRLRSLFTWVGAGALSATLSACGSPAGGLCARLDECNALTGQSVSECTENTERALEQFSSNARADCERSIDQCNELSACSNFLDCNLNCDFRSVSNDEVPRESNGGSSSGD